MDIEGWNRYVNNFKANFEECKFKEALIRKCGGHKDIACAIYYHSLSNALDWMDRRIPALNNKVPSREIEIGNVNNVRQVIWRMPC